MTKFWSSPQLEDDGYPTDIETLSQAGLWYWVWKAEPWNQWGPHSSEADAIEAVIEAVAEVELSRVIMGEEVEGWSIVHD